jgi:hypothetical protein
LIPLDPEQPCLPGPAALEARVIPVASKLHVILDVGAGAVVVTAATQLYDLPINLLVILFCTNAILTLVEVSLYTTG